MSEKAKKNEPKTEEKKSKRTDAEIKALADKHHKKIEHAVQRVDDWMITLTKAIQSKRYPLTPEDKAYVLSYVSAIYERFGNAMSQKTVDTQKFSLKPPQ